jgi:hypothetical protein
MLQRGLSRLAEQRGAWLIPVILAAVLLLWGIDNHGFWGDEAYTAVLARNVLKTGYPTAWDGRNLLAYNNGAPLNRDLVDNQIPWVQYYAAAAGFALFGEGTMGGRLPFALMGVATVAALYLAALRLTGSRLFAFGCSTLLALWVPFLLFARQCRYYAPSMLAATLMLAAWPDLSLKRKGKFALFAGACVLFIHSQHLMFVCFFAALLVADLVLQRRRERIIAMLVAVPIVAALFLPWVLAVGVPDDPGGRAFGNLNPTNALTLLWWQVREYNRDGFFPVLMLIPWVLGAVSARGERRLAVWMFPCTVAAGYTVLMSLLSPQWLAFTQLAFVRYSVPLLPVFILMLGQSLAWLWSRARAMTVFVVVLCVGTDLLTAGFMRAQYGDEVRRASPLPLPLTRCLIAEYAWENLYGYDTTHDVVIATLDANVRPGETIAVFPPMLGDPLMFYLGDRLTFVSVLPPNDTRLLPHVRDRLPDYVSRPVKPDWVVAFGMDALVRGPRTLGITDADGYETTVLSYYWKNTSRPELHWRTFKRLMHFAHPDEYTFILQRRRVTSSGRAGK